MFQSLLMALSLGQPAAPAQTIVVNGYTYQLVAPAVTTPVQAATCGQAAAVSGLNPDFSSCGSSSQGRRRIFGRRIR